MDVETTIRKSGCSLRQASLTFFKTKRFEFHYTPKHGSWLDIAEIELAALAKQCLGKRRIDSLEVLNSELEKWYTDRNQRQKGVEWQFTTDDARVRLKHLYPIVNF